MTNAIVTEVYLRCYVISRNHRLIRSEMRSAISGSFIVAFPSLLDA